MMNTDSVLGSKVRPELIENIERNRALNITKGDILKVTKYSDYTLNNEHIYDEVETYEVISIRKSKNGRRVKVRNLKFGYTPTLLIDECRNKIEIINA